MLSTLVHDQPVFVGSQWVVFVPTEMLKTFLRTIDLALCLFR